MTMRGFTLLEVLVAVAITASIGVGATQLLSSIIDGKRRTDARSEQLAALQRFNQVVSRDVSQFISRPIRDEYGDKKPPMVLSGSQYLIEFSRAGWRDSPIGDTLRSTLQRVAYGLESLESDACKPALERLQEWRLNTDGDCLVRYYWSVLDRAPDSEPKTQVLLDQVVSLKIDVLGHVSDSDDWFSEWPPLSTNGKKPYLRALKMQLEFDRLGDVERVWPLADDRSMVIP